MNRQDFLKLGLGAIAANTLPLAPILGQPHSSAGLGAKAKFKKSLKIGMVAGQMSLLEKFKLLKSLGFDGVELDSPGPIDRQEVREAKAQTGLEVPGVVCSEHWKSPFSSPEASVRAKCAEAMLTALEDCRAVGGTTVLLVPAVVNAEVSYAEAYARSQAEIKKLLPIAKKIGVKIAIENVWNNFLLSPLEAARYIDEFKHDMIGWYFDVGNIVRYGFPDQWIKILGKRILKVDVKEYSRKLAEDKGVWKGFDAELTEGDCNWPRVMQALTDIGYLNGWGSAEVPGGEADRLRKISEGMDKINQS
jgi:L-ribulose-5-phosphate 3-epimerase